MTTHTTLRSDPAIRIVGRRWRAASARWALVIGVVISAGCGGADGSAKANAPGTTTSTPAGDSSTSTAAVPLRVSTEDPCALLTQEQVDQLVGEPTTAANVGSNTLAGADPLVIAGLGIAASGDAVTLSICGYTTANPKVGLGVSLYTLASGETTDFSAADDIDVSDRIGVPAIQETFDPQEGWVIAILDERHVAATSSVANADLNISAMRQVVENLR